MTLMLDMSIPDYTGKTYGDVIDYAITLKGIALECNANLASLGEWANVDN